MKEKIEITAESLESLIEKLKGEIVKKAEGMNRFELLLFDFYAFEEILFRIHSGYTRSEIRKIIEGLLEERRLKLHDLKVELDKKHQESESQLQNEMQKIISEIQTKWIKPQHPSMGVKNLKEHYSLIHEVPGRWDVQVEERLYACLADKSGCKKLNGIRDRKDRERERFDDYKKHIEEEGRLYSKLDKILQRLILPVYKELIFSVKESKEKTKQLPKYTRKRLIEIFQEVGADISGKTSSEFYSNRGDFNRLQSSDIYGEDKVKALSFIYATRNSLQNNKIMQISESEVFLPINAGISASIKFQPSSNFIRENLTKPAQLYCMHFVHIIFEVFFISFS